MGRVLSGNPAVAFNTNYLRGVGMDNQRMLILVGIDKPMFGDGRALIEKMTF